MRGVGAPTHPQPYMLTAEHFLDQAHGLIGINPRCHQPIIGTEIGTKVQPCELRRIVLQKSGGRPFGALPDRALRQKCWGDSFHPDPGT